MRHFVVLLLFIAVHAVAAAIGDENNTNEIPSNDTSEGREWYLDEDDMSEDSDYDWEEDWIISEDSDYDWEEDWIISEDYDLDGIAHGSISQYSLYIPRKTDSDDESDSKMSEKDEPDRNETGAPATPSPSESKVRKKRNSASCAKANAPKFNCDAKSKYRTIDGSCNNLQHPDWGAAMTCQPRFIPPNYKKGTKAGLRDSVEGGPLPRPRDLSLGINKNESRPDKNRTHMSVFWGQFVAHDLVLTPMFAIETGEILPCCQKELRKDRRCANVYTRKDDPFYGPLNHTCMDLPRSVACNSCDGKGRKLLNVNTAFLDGSPIYGSSLNTSMSLRTNDGTGKLISQNTPQGELLPNSFNPQHDQCSFPDKNLTCFQAGDGRVNQHIMITCIQTILLRLHNRIASKLKEVNPSWGEEKLFQETRRIVGAIIQIIVYGQYLPIVLGPWWIEKYGLGLSDGFTEYDPTLNPAIWIEFSTAAFRVPHSTVSTVVSTKPRAVTLGHEWMRDLYSLPFGLHNDSFEGLMEDTTRTPAEQVDRFAVQDTNDYMYKAPGDPGGLDMSAIDIQRGRDNGIPTYDQMVKYCHDVEISDFEDIVRLGLISKEDVEILKKNYKSARDVDLVTALQMEIEGEEDSLFRQTSACVVAFQFHRQKYADRYYFEHGGQAGSFTLDQKNELMKKVSLTQIICQNVEGISQLPKNPMLFASPTNEEVKCSDIEDLDFSLWKEASE